MAEVDPSIEKLLVDFVTHANEELLGEHSTKNLHNKVDLLHKTIANVAENLSEHVQDCHQRRLDSVKLAASTDKRLVTLEAGATPATASLPPMRSREDSSHDLAEVADKVTIAAIEGFKSPDKTPEESVAKVVEEIQTKRDNARRLAELEAAERQRMQDAIDRRKLMGKLAIAAVSGGGAIATLVEAIRGFLAGHH